MTFDGIKKLEKTNLIIYTAKGWRVVYRCEDITDHQYYDKLFYRLGNCLHGTFEEYCIERN